MHTNVGHRLKIWRNSISKSQKDAAGLIGIHPNTYQNYERGVREPDASAIRAFYGVGINTNWLLTGEGSMLVGYRPDSSATVLTAEETIAQYGEKPPEIDAVLLSGVIAAVDMANPQLGASERAAIAAKAYTEAVSSAQARQSDKIFLP